MHTSQGHCKGAIHFQRYRLRESILKRTYNDLHDLLRDFIVASIINCQCLQMRSNVVN